MATFFHTAAKKERAKWGKKKEIVRECVCVGKGTERNLATSTLQKSKQTNDDDNDLICLNIIIIYFFSKECKTTCFYS